MYIPKLFENTNKAQIIAFMQKYSFGTLVTATNNLPVATHIPFVITQRDNEVYITSHFAKANPQGNQLAGNPVLVIFTEPHAYISPKHYEKEQTVPTWNYIAVHAYGMATVLDTEEQQLKMMDQMILNFDADYLNQWNGLPDEYKLRMLKGVTGFEIKVTSLQAVNKLSQNKTEAEKAKIINTLQNSTDSNEAAIAEYMKNC